MEPVSYSVSAPGSLFLFGEHAVLHEKKSIVMTVDKRIRASIVSRRDRHVMIRSALGTLESDLDRMTVQEPFRFVTAAIVDAKTQLPFGFELTIESEFSHEVGLGSSAAVTLCVCALLNKLMKPKKDILLWAKTIVQQVQGVGSGADLTASFHGGAIVYQMKAPFMIERFVHLPDITVVYSGFKTPTVKVIQHVAEHEKKFLKSFTAVYQAIDAVVSEAIEAFRLHHWQRLGALANIQQGLMEALGVGLPSLTRGIERLRADSGIYGAKISGSGLGDCLIGIGRSSLEEALPIHPSTQGLCDE